MADSKILRFGIRAISGRRAATWKVWNEGGAASDVYIACRALGGELKASLHESGKWHISYSKPFFRTGFENVANKPTSRFPISWPRPAELSPGFTVAFRIAVPWNAATSRAQNGDEDITWLHPAKEGFAKVFSVLFTTKPCPEGQWPGQRSMKTELVGALDLQSGPKVWVVASESPYKTPPAVTGVPSFFMGRGKPDLLSQDLRAVAFAHEPDGSIILYDLPIRVSRSVA